MNRIAIVFALMVAACPPGGPTGGPDAAAVAADAPPVIADDAGPVMCVPGSTSRHGASLCVCGPHGQISCTIVSDGGATDGGAP